MMNFKLYTMISWSMKKEQFSVAKPMSHPGSLGRLDISRAIILMKMTRNGNDTVKFLTKNRILLLQGTVALNDYILLHK